MSTAMTPSGRLAGKVALITGAAGNLGSEIVRHFLREGALVVLSGRTAPRLEAARDAAVKDVGVPLEQTDMVVMDGADPASVRAGMTGLMARHGRIDILINNAGSAGPRQPLEKVPLTAEEEPSLIGLPEDAIESAIYAVGEDRRSLWKIHPRGMTASCSWGRGVLQLPHD